MPLPLSNPKNILWKCHHPNHLHPKDIVFWPVTNSDIIKYITVATNHKDPLKYQKREAENEPLLNHQFHHSYIYTSLSLQRHPWLGLHLGTIPAYVTITIHKCMTRMVWMWKSKQFRWNQIDFLHFCWVMATQRCWLCRMVADTTGSFNWVLISKVCLP